jgi:hypothetical protein
MKKLFMVAALVAAAVSIMLIPATAGADPGGGAQVINEGASCVYEPAGTGRTYGALLHQVTTPNGTVNQSCTNLDLIIGSPVTKTTVTKEVQAISGAECTAVEFPSGKATITCHGQLA